MRRPALFVCVAASVLIAGCGGPVVTVRHTLPAAVPLPAGVETVRVRKFAVHAADTGEVAALLTESLQKRLSRHWAIDGDSRARARAVDVGGTITLETKDVKGTRAVRRWEGETREWHAVQMPTLVRSATATVEFAVFGPGAKDRLFTIETRRSYTSPEDPRVRGELGLERPDDPARVPPMDQILRVLLGQCADSLVEMISPREVTADVPMRGTWNSAGSAGLKAAAEGDFAAAIRHLQAAVASDPRDVNLLFDLAVACEAAGRLEDALKHYRVIVERTKGQDAIAAEAAKRVERVLKRLGKRPEGSL